MGWLPSSTTITSCLNCDNLSAIFCHNNQIKGEAIDELIEGLPFKPGERGLLCTVNTEDEQNVMTKAQVAAAKAKGWIPCYKYGTFGEYGYPDYEGIDDPTNIGATLNDNGKMTNDSWYDLSGRKINSSFSTLHSSLKKGVYIMGGKKVLIP